ncbi:MAG: hypothetical protein ACRDIB_14125, partial [Ardenticatenaceae bacterium]
MQWEWEVLEEKPLRAKQEAEPQRARSFRRRLGTILLVLLVVIGATGAILWRQVRQQQPRLRAELTTVVHEEARLMALEREAREQAEALLDPAAPIDWRYRYDAYPYYFFGEEKVLLPSLPEVKSVRLAEDGELALVEVSWPRPPGALGEVTDRRAYRLVEGAWRRTPYPIADEATEVEVENITFHGRSEDIALLTSGPMDVVVFRMHLEETWPEEWFNQH